MQKKLEEIQTEILNLERQIETKTNKKDESNEGDLDQFMIELNTNSNNKSLSKLKFKLEQLRSEETRISQLAEIAKPCDILLSPKIEEKVLDIPRIPEESGNLREEKGNYGLKLAPGNRKQEYLKRTAEKGAEDLENPAKKVYTVELPPHLKGS